MKPMLACDYDPKKLFFPAIIQPKIDGFRGVHLTPAGLLGRSGKAHANKFTTQFFSHPVLRGLDGELAAQSETHPDLCRLTTSACSTQLGSPFVLWHVFDLIVPDTMGEPYRERLKMLYQFYEVLKMHHPELANRIRPIKWKVVSSIEELEAQDALWLAEGYEGTIGRDPDGMYKEGRSTPREGGLWRVKRFVEEEAVVLGVSEGTTNTNEATLTPHGYTERSTHQANMVPNGMVGTLHCETVKTKQLIDVAPGRATHDERRAWWNDKSLIVSKTIKYKKFLKGQKDLPRFPTFQVIKVASDIGTDV
jgi:DNA ligase-1